MNYVIGVSGGVDSVALLAMVLRGEIVLPECEQVIVAHVDHGIREESANDAVFVQNLAAQYNLTFELGQAKLGPNASEDQARTVRYKFLRSCCKKYNAPLVLAHHRDDRLETMIINLIRGTSWRGLVSLRSTASTLRPLLTKSKNDLVTYAQAHHLTWVEDVTNTDQMYLRNYIRHTLVPTLQTKDGQFGHRMLQLQRATQALRPQIDSELALLAEATMISNNNYICSRYQLTMWPQNAASEYIYTVLTRLDPSWHPERQHIIRVLHFAKTAQPGRTMVVAKHLKIESKKRHLEFKKL